MEHKHAGRATVIMYIYRVYSSINYLCNGCIIKILTNGIASILDMSLLMLLSTQIYLDIVIFQNLNRFNIIQHLNTLTLIKSNSLKNIGGGEKISIIAEADSSDKQRFVALGTFPLDSYTY